LEGTYDHPAHYRLLDWPWTRVRFAVAYPDTALPLALDVTDHAQGAATVTAAEERLAVSTSWSTTPATATAPP
jgi:hypothetical protein